MAKASDGTYEGAWVVRDGSDSKWTEIGIDSRTFPRRPAALQSLLRQDVSFLTGPAERSQPFIRQDAAVTSAAITKSGRHQRALAGRRSPQVGKNSGH